MGKISIGFIVNNLTVGGISSVLIKLCNKLSPSKYNVHLIVLSDDFSMVSYLPLRKHIKTHICLYEFEKDYSLLGYLKTAFLSSSDRAKPIVDKIKDLKLDILHFHTLPRQLIIGRLAHKENKNLKLVYTDHLVRISKNEYKAYQSKILKIAFRKLYKKYNIIAVSRSVKAFLSDNKITNSNKEFKLLENTIDIDSYSRTKKIEYLEENCVIYISRINHHKGQNTLIHAWSNIKAKSKGKLLLVGPDETNGRMSKLAAHDDSIIFTGSLGNVKEILDQATLAIFPSQKEGLPISLLEKMAFKLPLIVSDIPELTSVIEDKVHGLHFKLNNVEDLQKKIEFALTNKSIMIKMGLNARKKVEEICLKNDAIAFHDKLYSDILNN